LSRFISSVQIGSSDAPSAHTPLSACHEADVLAHATDQREQAALHATSRSTVVTNEDLARRWFIGLNAATCTLLSTTQEGMRFVDGDLEQRL